MAPRQSPWRLRALVVAIGAALLLASFSGRIRKQAGETAAVTAAPVAAVVSGHPLVTNDGEAHNYVAAPSDLHSFLVSKMPEGRTAEYYTTDVRPYWRANDTDLSKVWNGSNGTTERDAPMRACRRARSRSFEGGAVATRRQAKGTRGKAMVRAGGEGERWGRGRALGAKAGGGGWRGMPRELRAHAPSDRPCSRPEGRGGRVGCRWRPGRWAGRVLARGWVRAALF